MIVGVINAVGATVGLDIGVTDDFGVMGTGVGITVDSRRQNATDNNNTKLISIKTTTVTLFILILTHFMPLICDRESISHISKIRKCRDCGLRKFIFTTCLRILTNSHRDT